MGVYSVDGLLDNLSAREFNEWIEYHSLEPFGENRQAFNTGILASVIANANRAKKSKVYKPQDFIPKFDNPKQSWKKQLSIVESMNIFYGGVDMR